MEEIAVNATDLAWEPAEGYPEGTMRKVLRRDADDKPLTVLLKLPAGFQMADHTHVCTEQHYVLDGEYEVAGRRYHSGHYRMYPAQTSHGPFRTEIGAVVLVLWELCT
ncbi:MAG: cupin domain-containing protein [Candidatus Krumholzibacteriia bacterium]